MHFRTSTMEFWRFMWDFVSPGSARFWPSATRDLGRRTENGQRQRTRRLGGAEPTRTVASLWLLRDHGEAATINNEGEPIRRRSGRQRSLHVAYAGQVGSDYVQQFVVVGWLLKVGGCAGLQCALLVVLRVARAQHDHGNARQRVAFLQPIQNDEAISGRQPEVE